MAQYDGAIKERVMWLLGTGKGVTETAKETGVSETTIKRWRAKRKAAMAAAAAAQQVAATAAVEFERWRRENLPAISGILDGEPPPKARESAVTAEYTGGRTETWTTADDIPPRAERRQEADSVRLGTVVSVVLIVGSVLVGVWVAMKGGL